jgi:thioredoxin-related protein
LALIAGILLFASAALAQDYDSALKAAKRDNKPVLLYFYSRSCYYCRLMDGNTLADKEIDAMLKKDFVYLRIDVDRSTDLGRLYRITGTPSSWFLESSGTRIGVIPGYVEAKSYRRILEYVKGKLYNQVDLPAYLKGSAGK